MKWPTLNRQEYTAMLARGAMFRAAYLYEPDNATKGTQFVYVDLGPGVGVQFKRVITLS